ncbi:hypothetical protein U472_00120 [Orenia metallireducens]|uniref:Uncharacterized protein n=1 Tax=Orenia metallireducens TaxID=1413210 RepID=A0A1C0ADJ3_9FIRM|nr:hypothetical protein [Orenia metallireducens]OCL28760.1 hypothetical protein U472_00120 [Orenia metallireducens]
MSITKRLKAEIQDINNHKQLINFQGRLATLLEENKIRDYSQYRDAELIKDGAFMPFLVCYLVAHTSYA